MLAITSTHPAAEAAVRAVSEPAEEEAAAVRRSLWVELVEQVVARRRVVAAERCPSYPAMVVHRSIS
jgi:hypothetical protein